jgi:hypothetical protein
MEKKEWGGYCGQKTSTCHFFVGLVLLLGHIVPFPASAITGILHTEQVQCYGQTPIGQDEVSCSGNGQDGEKRSGAPWPCIRFLLTYFDSTGPWAGQSADCDANVSTDMITDNFTGLMWTKNVARSMSAF